MAILKTRTTEGKQVNLAASPFVNALRLFPRVSDCDLHNDRELQILGPTKEVLSRVRTLDGVTHSSFEPQKVKANK